MLIQQRTDACRLAGEVPPMAIACVLRPYGAFRAAAQCAHDFVIGWMSHLFPPPWQAIPRHARSCHTLPALPPPSLGPARRSAPHCSRRLRTFSITVSNPPSRRHSRERDRRRALHCTVAMDPPAGRRVSVAKGLSLAPLSNVSGFARVWLRPLPPEQKQRRWRVLQRSP